MPKEPTSGLSGRRFRAVSSADGTTRYVPITPYLHWQGWFAPKTAYRALSSRMGAPQKPIAPSVPWYHAKQVTQSIKPREFTATISQIIQAKMEAEIYEVVEEGLREAGMIA
ncbi:MAG: hypothetical protein GF334_04225 [Candidatus Altiarchaeales archaeon]|nr:hypothetical protein [Candidatus Altiarchaeales archaeon]